jgi:hypothetical protein
VSSTRVVLEDKKVRVIRNVLPVLIPFLCLQIIEHSKDFVSDVIRDESVQREGGDALLKTVAHALRPGIARFELNVLTINLLIYS